MATPNFTFDLVATPVTSGYSAQAGDCLVESASGYLLSTSGNRGTKKTSGVARGSAPINGAVIMQAVGDLPASVSGLGPGSQSYVRVSTAGRLERVASPSVSDDVVGYAEADGLVHLFCGQPFGGGGGGASLTGTTNGVLSLSGANAGYADQYWMMSGSSNPGHFIVQNTNNGVIDVGYTKIYANGDDPNTFLTPGGGMYRFGYFVCDGPFHGDSLSIFSYLASTENTEASAFDVSAMGISGGVPFFGDPTHLTQTNVYGDGCFFDAGPGGGGAGTHPLTDHTGEHWFQNKALDAAVSGFSKGYIRLLNYGSNGILTLGASGYVYSAFGSALQSIRVNAGGTALEWYTPSGGLSAPTGTGFWHNTAGALDAAARAVNLASADVSGLLALGNQAAPTGTGYAKVSAGAWAAASQAVPIPIADGGTNLTAVPGNASEVLINSGGTAYATASGVKAGTNFLSVGTTPGGTGMLRFPTTQNILGWRNVGNTADIVGLATDGTDQLFICGDTASAHQAPFCRIIPSSQLIVQIGVAAYYQAASSANLFFQAVNLMAGIGGSAANSTPYTEPIAAITQSSTADTTLSAAQYSCPQIDFSGTPGGAFNVIGPNVAGAIFKIRNTTPSTLTIKKSGGTGVGITTGISRLVRHNGTDYVFGDA